ncbi:integrase [Gossypium australe]|uniref:Integrase n=1 Tax=Gossypium australe TaxID=47621 RepID=A0A5B6WRW2_9ROSI|nr:integrase [Gossypium australe]
MNFVFNSDGKLCVIDDKELKHAILQEGYSNLYTMHPIRNKMYWNLKELYWWPNFVGKCLTCQQGKFEHQFPSSLLQPLKFPQ